MILDNLQPLLATYEKVSEEKFTESELEFLDNEGIVRKDNIGLYIEIEVVWDDDPYRLRVTNTFPLNEGDTFNTADLVICHFREIHNGSSLYEASNIQK